MLKMQWKFEQIINAIEQEIQKKASIKPSDIVKTVGSKFGYSERAIKAIFFFLTEESIWSYVKRRQMECALGALCFGSSVEDAICYTGFSTQSGFISSCSKTFGAPPSVVARHSYLYNFRGPITWLSIMNQEISSSVKKEENDEFEAKASLYDCYAEDAENEEELMKEQELDEDMALIYGLDEFWWIKEMKHVEDCENEMSAALFESYEKGIITNLPLEYVLIPQYPEDDRLDCYDFSRDDMDSEDYDDWYEPSEFSHARELEMEAMYEEEEAYWAEEAMKQRVQENE